MDRSPLTPHWRLIVRTDALATWRPHRSNPDNGSSDLTAAYPVARGGRNRRPLRTTKSAIYAMSGSNPRFLQTRTSAQATAFAATKRPR